MNLLSRVREALIQRSIRRAIRDVSAADAETLLSSTSDRVLRTFRRAATTVPAYHHLLDREGVSPANVTSLEEFQRQVPVVDKKGWFGSDLRDICTGGNLEEIASFYSSSGMTGSFSYGVETRAEQQQSALSLEFALQQAFGVLDRRTLLINCLPMGVHIQTRSLALAETSVREDVVWALLRKLRGEFEQFVIVGEHPFLKHLVEEAVAQADPIEWPALRVHVITGAEYVAENFRSYLSALLGMDVADPDSGSIVVNYGLSELSVSIARENWHTIQIRRFASNDTRFREALCEADSPFYPNVMQYYPSQVYLETPLAPSGREELLVTMLDEHRRIPIVRYNTGDHARVMPHERLARLLRDFDRADLIPPLQLPVILMWGKCKGFSVRSGTIYPEAIKEALYEDFRIASSVTGNFRLRGTQEEPEVLIQLKERVELSDETRMQIQRRSGQDVNSALTARIVAFGDFPYGRSHDFERKNQYLDAAS